MNKTTGHQQGMCDDGLGSWKVLKSPMTRVSPFGEAESRSRQTRSELCGTCYTHSWKRADTVGRVVVDLGLLRNCPLPATAKGGRGRIGAEATEKESRPTLP